MKKIYILAIIWVAFVPQTYGQETAEIHWMSMNEALKAQQENPKKIIMDAYAVWCGPCKMMDKRTFENPDVIKYINKNFYAVKFNAEGDEEIHYRGETYGNPKYDPDKKETRNYPHDFSRVLGLRGYPTMVFFDEGANLIAPIIGYKSPRQLEIFLKLVASNDYKKVQTAEDWAKYQKAFTPTFGD